MAKYVYPATFTKENDGYSVVFPDIDGCYTCGDSLEEALYMAEDALALMLYHLEAENLSIPTPSNTSDIVTDSNTIVNLIRCDTLAYQRMFNNKSVKKTLTIPEWINERALAMDINFSQVLQDALLQKMNLS